jgi:hypothetical protein
VKTPAQLVIGTARLLGLEGVPMAQLVRAMDLMGQALFIPPNVGGWPRGDSWITTGSILTRYNFSSLVLTGGMFGVSRRPAARPALPVEVLKAATLSQNAGDAVERITALLIHGAMVEEKKHALLKALGGSMPQAAFSAASGEAESRLRSALHLLMCSPEYQLA